MLTTTKGLVTLNPYKHKEENVMPIYKVTTEGDCEGRSIKELGYVRANSAEHAVKFLHSIGKTAYDNYSVSVVDNLILEATPEEQLNHLMTEANHRMKTGGWNGKVKTNEQVLKQKKQIVRQALANAGLSYEDVMNFGKD